METDFCLAAFVSCRPLNHYYCTTASEMEKDSDFCLAVVVSCCRHHASDPYFRRHHQCPLVDDVAWKMIFSCDASSSCSFFSTFAGDDDGAGYHSCHHHSHHRCLRKRHRRYGFVSSFSFWISFFPLLSPDLFPVDRRLDLSVEPSSKQARLSHVLVPWA